MLLTNPLAEHQPEEVERAHHYSILCDTLKRMRDTAVKGRAESGIEEIWVEDQEFYDGIDDANREEKVSKPSSMSQGLRTGTPKKTTANRSCVFVELTRPYCDAGSARVADMLLPTDDRNWMAQPTPVPELVQLVKNTPPLQPGQQPTQVDQAAEEARQAISQAKLCAEKAQARIEDWLTECQFLDECRLVIDDAARIGTGVLKGPFPKSQRKKAVIRALEGIGIVIKQNIVPVSKRVNVWKFYPDPDCGEDIQNGKFVFELDEINGRQLSDLRDIPGYLADVIDKILEEGPEGHDDVDAGDKTNRNRSDAETYKIWYFHGYLSAKDLDTLGEAHGSGEQFPVIATVINDKIIKAAISPLDSGEFPYDVFVWQRRPGHWAGKGIARQMRTEQRGVNAATRALMDNMGASSRPHKVINRRLIENGPDPWTHFTKQDEDVLDVTKAVTFFAAPSLQAELQGIIEFWMKRAEDATSMPMLIQGQLGNAPDTVGGMQMLNNNASTVLRRIAKAYDSQITERHISRYYEWLLIHGKDDSEKGDFTIKARGSSALIERDMQAQVLLQASNMAANPIFELSPAKIMAKFLKSQRLDIEDLKMSDEEKQRFSQGQPDPRIAAAQIREQGEMQRFQEEIKLKQQAMQAEQEEAQRKFQIEIERLKVEQDKLKVQLAETSMKLRTQSELSQAAIAQADDHKVTEHMVDLHKHSTPQVSAPPAEPVGQARPGEAFQA